MSNMPIYAYKNVSKKEIKAQRFTSEGRSYTLNHPDELVISMRYKGKGMSTANSQGWERNSDYYFKELSNRHPEFFSKKNTNRIQKGESPLVDKKFCEYFPQYEGFKNEVLIHHHIGKNGQAVAIPASMHKGSGEIHIFENKLGITENSARFSAKCDELKQTYNMKNMSTDQCHEIVDNYKGDEEDMAKTLKLTNDYYRQPTKEELMASGEASVDKRMEIYRDEMRNDGMQDGSEMEEIISQRREADMAELRKEIYGEEANSFSEAGDYTSEDDLDMQRGNIDEAGEAQLSENSFAEDEVSNQSDISEDNSNSFSETGAVFDGNNSPQEEYSTSNEDDLQLEDDSFSNVGAEDVEVGNDESVKDMNEMGESLHGEDDGSIEENGDFEEQSDISEENDFEEAEGEFDNSSNETFQGMTEGQGEESEFEMEDDEDFHWAGESDANTLSDNSFSEDTSLSDTPFSMDDVGGGQESFSDGIDLSSSGSNTGESLSDSVEQSR